MTADCVQGMYAAADEIRQRLLGRTRQEVRLEAIRTQGRVSETEVDTMMERERRILPEIFQEHKVCHHFPPDVYHTTHSYMCAKLWWCRSAFTYNTFLLMCTIPPIHTCVPNYGGVGLPLRIILPS